MQIVPYANLHAEYLECQTAVDTAIARCLRNSSFIQGPEVVNFEHVWASYTDSPACAGVSSGTSALMLALLAVGVQAGDEVIVPTMSFIATAEVVSQIGAKPVFVDIDQYHTIDIDQVRTAITERTRAIIFVDLYGQTTEISLLKSIAGTIPLIEDAAQASGCLYRGKPIGNLVDLTCYSFYPGKNLSAIGDAGAITGSPELIERVRMLRDHGRREKYVHEMVGWNERLDALQAAVVSAKVPYLKMWNARRIHNANYYLQELAHVRTIELPRQNPVSSHVYNQFVIQTEHRDSLKKYLAEFNIEAGIQFPLAMHQQPVYASDCSLPVAERLAKTCISLPVHAQLTDEDLACVVKYIKRYFSTDRRIV